MSLRAVTSFVIATATLVCGQSPRAAQPEPRPLTDPDAYAIYAALLPGTWASVSKKEALLLQQETEDIKEVASCLSSAGRTAEPEWEAVDANFRQMNATRHRLELVLPMDYPYRLIPRAEILADDARLALKYPGTWQHRPESMEYAAVSAVGFNATKDKALVYIRLRSSGRLTSLELTNGVWIVAGPGGCGWVA
jgi:hypothetical protein